MLLLTVFLASFISAFVSSAIESSTSSLYSVTIFTESPFAVVQKRFAFPLNESSGNQELVFRGFPRVIDLDSVRVSSLDSKSEILSSQLVSSSTSRFDNPEYQSALRFLKSLLDLLTSEVSSSQSEVSRLNFRRETLNQFVKSSLVFEKQSVQPKSVIEAEEYFQYLESQSLSLEQQSIAVSQHSGLVKEWRGEVNKLLTHLEVTGFYQPPSFLESHSFSSGSMETSPPFFVTLPTFGPKNLTLPLPSPPSSCLITSEPSPCWFLSSKQFPESSENQELHLQVFLPRPSPQPLSFSLTYHSRSASWQSEHDMYLEPHWEGVREGEGVGVGVGVGSYQLRVSSFASIEQFTGEDWVWEHNKPPEERRIEYGLNSEVGSVPVARLRLAASSPSSVAPESPLPRPKILRFPSPPPPPFHFSRSLFENDFNNRMEEPLMKMSQGSIDVRSGSRGVSSIELQSGSGGSFGSPVGSVSSSSSFSSSPPSSSIASFDSSFSVSPPELSLDIAEGEMGEDGSLSLSVSSAIDPFSSDSTMGIPFSPSSSSPSLSEGTNDSHNQGKGESSSDAHCQNNSQPSRSHSQGVFGVSLSSGYLGLSPSIDLLMPASVPSSLSFQERHMQASQELARRKLLSNRGEGSGSGTGASVESVPVLPSNPHRVLIQSVSFPALLYTFSVPSLREPRPFLRSLSRYQLSADEEGMGMRGSGLLPLLPSHGGSRFFLEGQYAGRVSLGRVQPQSEVDLSLSQDQASQISYFHLVPKISSSLNPSSSPSSSSSTSSSSLTWLFSGAGAQKRRYRVRTETFLLSARNLRPLPSLESAGLPPRHLFVLSETLPRSSHPNITLELLTPSPHTLLTDPRSFSMSSSTSSTSSPLNQSSILAYLRTPSSPFPSDSPFSSPSSSDTPESSLSSVSPESFLQQIVFGWWERENAKSVEERERDSKRCTSSRSQTSGQGKGEKEPEENLSSEKGFSVYFHSPSATLFWVGGLCGGGETRHTVLKYRILVPEEHSQDAEIKIEY